MRVKELQTARGWIKVARGCFVLAMGWAKIGDWERYDRYTGLGIDALLSAMNCRAKARRVYS